MTSSDDAILPLNSLPSLLDARTVEHDGGDRARVAIEVSPDWLQGRTSFGGLSAAFGVQAMRDAAAPHGWPADVILRALQMSFIGPVGAGIVEVDAQILRAGRSIRQVQSTLRQSGAVVGVALGVFAVGRTSLLEPVRLRQPPARWTPGSLPRLTLHTRSERQFLRHFDLRWDDGPMPGSGGSGRSSRIHMRLADRDGLDDELATVLLADVSPTPVLGHFKTPVPGSSVTWALELQPLDPAPPSDGWWRADNESVIVNAGLVNHAARLWAPGGQLAAIGHQLVAVYG